MTIENYMSNSVENMPSGFERDISLPPFPEFDDAYLPSNVALHFYFAPHRTVEQFDEGKPLLQRADVFIPEAAGWNEQTQKDFNSISKGGDEKRYRKLVEAQQIHLNSGYAREQYEGLKGTYKPVVLIDAHRDRADLNVGDFTKRYRKGITSDVEDTLHGVASALASIAEMAYARDLIMGDNLGPKVTELVTNHPRLSNKEQVNVLLVLGFSHTELYQAMVDSGVFEGRIEETTWSGITEIDIETAVISTYKRGEVPTRDDMAEFLISWALTCTSLAVRPDKKLFNFDALYTRERDITTYIGQRVVDSMMQMGEEGLSIAHRLLRSVPTQEDAQLIADIANQAQELVAASFQE